MTMTDLPQVTDEALRTQTPDMLKRAQSGETLTITTRGVPVAQLGPVSINVEDFLVQPASKIIRFSDIKRVKSSVPTADVIEDLRKETV